jgi:hypothetical protein
VDEQVALNCPYSIDWNGRVIRFSGITQGVKAKCVAAAKLNAYEEARDFAAMRWPGNDAASINQRNEYINQVQGDLTTGRYKWGGDLQEKWRRNADGLAVLLMAMTEQAGTPLTREELEELSAEKQQQIAAVMVLTMWDCNNPKAKRPAPIQALADSLKPQTCTPG